MYDSYVTAPVLADGIWWCFWLQISCSLDGSAVFAQGQRLWLCSSCEYAGMHCDSLFVARSVVPRSRLEVSAKQHPKQVATGVTCTLVLYPGNTAVRLGQTTLVP